jgi:hypothetical protein
MSDVDRNSTYIDTVVSGSLVIQIAHNLGGTAYPSFYELAGGHKVFVSLYDPRIAEFKNLDDDNVQITFASNFAGYLDLIVYEFIRPSLTIRVQDLQAKYNDLAKTLDLYTPKTSWKQMNTYFDSKIKDLEATNADLQLQIDTLKQEVDSL